MTRTREQQAQACDDTAAKLGNTGTAVVIRKLGAKFRADISVPTEAEDKRLDTLLANFLNSSLSKK